MPTLGTQTISSSFGQLIKTFSTTGLDGSLQVITDGDNTSSALSLSTSGVQSTGSFTVSSNSSLLGPVTFGTNFTASTGTATIGTLSVSTATIATATISTATIPIQLGAITFGSNITASTGTATIGTLFASGHATFGTSFTASTGTATIGTESVNTSTIGTLSVTNTATVGTLKVGSAGPRLTAVSYGTAAFTLSTVQPHNLADTTTGTFALTGAALGDIVIGSIDSLGSTTGTTQIVTSFFPIASNVVRYVVNSKGSTAGTVPAGTIYATAMRFTA